MNSPLESSFLKHLLSLAVLLFASAAFGQMREPLLSLAAKQKPGLLETLRELVSIESGSRDLVGVSKLAGVIEAKLKALGGQVESIAPNDVYRMSDTPEHIGKMVRATYTGSGTKRILLIAHMDTVYPPGTLAKQPFRIEDDRAYGLGIADDKQGIALILHTLALLRAMVFRDYGQITVLINADEEISSPGSRSLLTKLGAEHDAIFSLEASRADSDKISLATSGIGSITLTVTGRASHAGFAPEQGVNALYELAHQILQTRDLSDPATGLKMNWTLANAGTTRNVIPPSAQATADVRVLRVADYDEIERSVRHILGNRLLPDTKVEMQFERRRPPLEASAASRALGQHAKNIYRELERNLLVDDQPEGGGTDAAFAALKSKAPVLERLGLQGYGEHSADAEYILLDSIEPRLYLLARLIIDVSQDKSP